MKKQQQQKKINFSIFSPKEKSKIGFPFKIPVIIMMIMVIVVVVVGCFWWKCNEIFQSLIDILSVVVVELLLLKWTFNNNNNKFKILTEKNWFQKMNGYCLIVLFKCNFKQIKKNYYYISDPFCLFQFFLVCCFLWFFLCMVVFRLLSSVRLVASFFLYLIISLKSDIIIIKRKTYWIRWQKQFQNEFNPEKSDETNKQTKEKKEWKFSFLKMTQCFFSHHHFKFVYSPPSTELNWIDIDIFASVAWIFRLYHHHQFSPRKKTKRNKKNIPQSNPLHLKSKKEKTKELNLKMFSLHTIPGFSFQNFQIENFLFLFLFIFFSFVLKKFIHIDFFYFRFGTFPFLQLLLLLLNFNKKNRPTKPTVVAYLNSFFAVFNYVIIIFILKKINPNF